MLYKHSVFIGLAVTADAIFAERRPHYEQLANDAHNIDLLWDGIDVEIEERPAAPPAARRARLLLGQHPPPLVVLGAFDSGTNLLHVLIERNFPSLECFDCFSSTRPERPWKHSNSGADDFYRMLETIDNFNVSDTVALMVVRSPVSQVASWIKAPYDLYNCLVFRQGGYFLYPCNVPIRAQVETKGVTKSTWTTVHFNSTMSIYNEYIRQYRTFMADKRFRHVKLVTYEEILYNPKSLVEQLAVIFGLPMPEAIDTIEAPAKDHGKPHGREAALQRYTDRQWLAEIDAESLRVLCQSLDLALISNITEGRTHSDDTRFVPTSYGRDCDFLP